MPDQLINNNFYQETAPAGPPIVIPDYIEAHGVFSLSADNKLCGTLWATKNGEVSLSDLGLANFAVYDKTGALVGISQSNISPNPSGQYVITPVAANLLQDLTHYVVKIGIVLESSERVAYTGIAIGE
jgi:hypothetical protein